MRVIWPCPVNHADLYIGRGGGVQSTYSPPLEPEPEAAGRPSSLSCASTSAASVRCSRRRATAYTANAGNKTSEKQANTAVSAQMNSEATSTSKACTDASSSLTVRTEREGAVLRLPGSSIAIRNTLLP